MLLLLLYIYNKEEEEEARRKVCLYCKNMSVALCGACPLDVVVAPTVQYTLQHS